MPLLRFSDWVPDAADFGNPGMITATNALPGRDSYKPVPGLSVISDALDARPRGAIEAFDKSSTSHQYAGDASKLYELDNNLSWVDRSKSGGYSTGDTEKWEFVRWENKVLAVNWNDSPQQITMGNANFSDLTTDFEARHITVIRDFVVVGNTNDSSDGEVANRVRWSAIGDETDWTVSSSTLSDFRDLTTGGPIQKILGGEVGIIVSERAVFRMSFAGTPIVFQIDEVLPDIGALASGTVTRLGDSSYFLSDRGFVELTGNGTSVNFIGAGIVDDFMLNDLDFNSLDHMSVVADPTSNRIFWAYPGAGSTAGTPNRIIVYDRTFGKWSLISQDTEFILKAKGIPTTLDELDALGFDDIDTMTPSLDSPQFSQEASQLAAFDTNNKLGFFRSATNKTATLTTNEAEIHSGRKTRLNAFRPVVDGGTVTAKVGTRDRQTDTVSLSSSLSQSSSGRFTTRANARYHRFELTLTGDWTDAVGVQVEGTEAPRGERRG